jgi:hypothetical protein
MMTEMMAEPSLLAALLEAQSALRGMTWPCPDLDCTEVAPGLFIGGIPSWSSLNVDVVVLAALEYQPTALPDLARFLVLRCPLDDDYFHFSKEAKQAAIKTVLQIVHLLKQGKSVLITCLAGRNRSALLAAMTLMLGFQFSAQQAIEQVRSRRSLSKRLKPDEILSNPQFTHFLERLGKAQI